MKRQLFSPLTKINRLTLKLKIKVYNFLEKFKSLISIK